MRTLLIVFVILAAFVAFKVGTAEPSSDRFDPEAIQEEARQQQQQQEKSAFPQANPLSARSLSTNLPQKGTWRGKPVLADLNGDGELDLVSAIRRWAKETPGEGVYVWLGDGKGVWTEATQGIRRDLGYGGADVADVDGDGHLDLAFSCHDFQPHLFLNFLHEEAGAWVSTTEQGLETSAIGADVALGDFNRDGHIDMAAVGQMPRKAGLIMFFGDGTGAMNDPVEFLSKHYYGAQLRMNDLDGDGNVELLAATSLGPLIWRWDEAEGKREYGPGLPGDDFKGGGHLGGADLAIDAMDLDGDGHKEVLLSGLPYEGHPALQVFKWDGEKWFSWGKGLPTRLDVAYFDAEFARLTPDGPISIVAAAEAGISIFNMEAPGEFSLLGRIEGTEGSMNLCLGDVTGDGQLEVVYVGFSGVRVLDVRLPARPARPR